MTTAKLQDGQKAGKFDNLGKNNLEVVQKSWKNLDLF